MGGFDGDVDPAIGFLELDESQLLAGEIDRLPGLEREVFLLAEEAGADDSCDHQQDAQVRELAAVAAVI
jgi:hypothetical protein